MFPGRGLLRPFFLSITYFAKPYSRDNQAQHLFHHMVREISHKKNNRKQIGTWQQPGNVLVTKTGKTRGKYGKKHDFIPILMNGKLNFSTQNCIKLLENTGLQLTWLERLNGIQQVVGSIPISSICISPYNSRGLFFSLHRIIFPYLTKPK